ncbi:MAG: hypothetical protein D3916_07565 [Candidatus Electrothrix sp. MAN1_4]|nr:hypothetical protein [Candidatus Electrothrix sp. MAN1_4]
MRHHAQHRKIHKFTPTDQLKNNTANLKTFHCKAPGLIPCRLRRNNGTIFIQYLIQYPTHPTPWGGVVYFYGDYSSVLRDSTGSQENKIRATLSITYLKKT